MQVTITCLLLLLATTASGDLVGYDVARASDQVLESRASQPCNNYIELCDRKYSNITEVCAHNSPFYVPGNIASNQMYDVITQLNDGIRMLQGQTHKLNGTLHFCHTFCELLDGGTIEAYFKNVTQWLENHPQEVVTILLANGDDSPVTDFVDPIQKSGLGQLVYTPPKIPMTSNDWPSLGQLISQGRRVILFMDYEANQETVPYVLDQYSQLWETPFSPTDANFPCTINRPPNLSETDAKNRLYLANHNLNTNLDGLDGVLVPDLKNINRTNGVSGFGSLGLTSDSCTSRWGKPPNFLVVDYYNYGSPSAGSVFEVAAKANGVTYNRPCCGQNASDSGPIPTPSIIGTNTLTGSPTSTGAANSSSTPNLGTRDTDNALHRLIGAFASTLAIIFV